MIPACAALLPCTLTTRATIVPSPANGWYTKWNESELLPISEPEPETVNTPLLSEAPPFTFTDFEAVMGDVPALGEHTDTILRELEKAA